MNMKTAVVAGVALVLTGHCAAQGFLDDKVNFGADLRIRQEFMENVPGLPGGGML